MAESLINLAILAALFAGVVTVGVIFLEWIATPKRRGR